MIVLFILALSWLAAAVGLLARSAEAANSLTSHEAWIAIACCAAILGIAVTSASWLFRHRTSA
jgi:ABC-type Na+ efflux pump permease subunit